MEQITPNNGALARPGAWLLAPHIALTLQPTSAGVLRVWDGGLWATFDGPHAGRLNEQGDRLLQPGDAVPLAAGQRLVIERLQAAVPARFSWEAPAAAPAVAPRASARAGSTAREQPMKAFRSTPAFSVLGWNAPAPLARVMLALLACGLTASLWLGAAVASNAHRFEAGVTPTAPQPQDVRTARCGAPPLGRAPA